LKQIIYSKNRNTKIMKKSIKSICLALAVFCSVTLLTGCATLFGKKTAPVVLMNASGSVSVKENGSNLQIENVLAHGTAGNNSTTQYFASGVMLDKKIKHHTLSISSGGKTGTVEVKLRAGIKWIILDLFSGGILGWGIDAATKKWRIASKKYIDVDAVVNNTKPKRQGQLKRMMKRQARD
jgi:hypothetical protein